VNSSPDRKVIEKVIALTPPRDGAPRQQGISLSREIANEGGARMQAVETLVPKAASRVRRIDMRIVVGVMLMLFAVAGTASLVKKAQARIPVLVAARSVEPGSVIETADIRVAEISISRGLSYLAASREHEIVGRVAAESFSSGEILSPDAVVSKASLPPGYASMSIALKPSRAAAGSLRAGDHVAVISSPSAERGEATTILFTDVVVQSVRQGQTSEGSTLIVALRLRLEEARALAEAQSKGVIDLAVLGIGPEAKQ
jgi:Flp pilus assembly protein CpaB